MKILIYDYEEGLTLMNESEALFSLKFEMPNTEEEFESIEQKINYEGYSYTILNEDNSLYSSGIYTADSLYDDIIEAPRYTKI